MGYDIKARLGSGKKLTKIEQQKIKSMFKNIVGNRIKFGMRCLILPKGDPYRNWSLGSPGDLVLKSQLSSIYSLNSLAKKIVSNFHIYKLSCPACGASIVVTGVSNKGIVSFEHQMSFAPENFMASIFGMGQESSDGPCNLAKINKTVSVPMGTMIPWRPIWRMS